ncbi:hypothetical protein Tco_0898872 [Tanacetum coccineum]
MAYRNKNFDHTIKQDNLQVIKSIEEKIEARSTNDINRNTRIKLLQEVDSLENSKTMDLFQKVRVKWDIKNKFKDHDSNVDFPPFVNASGLYPLDREVLEILFSLDEVKNSVNGSHTSKFSIKHGLRQEDPLSPFLFILVMEGLHCALSNAVSTGVCDDNVTSMANNSGCALGSFPFTYLGLTIGSNMSLISSWQVSLEAFVVEGKPPFYKVRLTLIKLVLSSLGIYYFSIFKLHESVLSSLERSRATFFKVVQTKLGN